MNAQVMSGKTVLITGANSGIGKIAAGALAGMGASVILACRRGDAAREAMKEIRLSHPEAELEFLELDLASLKKVRAAAQEFLSRHQKLDVLINNAGLANVRRETTVDGYEMTFAVNHLGPFLFTELLLPALRKAHGRVINVASDAHRIGKMHWQDLHFHSGYFVMRAYAQSKLANILFTRELSRREEAHGVTVHALHPGAVATNIWPEAKWYEKLFSRFIKLFMISPEQGARTSIWLASNAIGGNSTGGYFEKCREKQPSKAARDDAAAQRLWKISEELTHD